MPKELATIVFVASIAGLFWLDRGDSGRPSKALWLAVIWLGTAGSRPLSAWLGMGPPAEIPGQLPESSSLDMAVAATLMLLGVLVLVGRAKDVRVVLEASWPVVLYFSFGLVSLLWSDFPAWAFKRWIRALGDVIMVLIIVTDAQPAAALRRFLTRLGFVLLPLSVLFIKYYPELGRGWDVFGGGVTNTGVTTNKNTLGAVVFVLSVGTLWQVIELVLDKRQPNRTRRLLAQVTLLYCGIFLVFTADSATSVVSFALGTGLMLGMAPPYFRGRPKAVHALVLAMLLSVSVTLLLGGRSAVTGALGRSSDFTGRTVIWEKVIRMVPSSVVGAGFETFWCGPRVARFHAMHPGLSMTNEAHNGYIEVYLNLGWVGVGLIGLILGQGYRTAVSTFRRDSTLGALLVAYVAASVAYNIGEAGFRMLSVPWFFLLLAILAAAASSVSARPVGLRDLARQRRQAHIARAGRATNAGPREAPGGRGRVAMVPTRQCSAS